MNWKRGIKRVMLLISILAMVAGVWSFYWVGSDRGIRTYDFYSKANESKFGLVLGFILVAVMAIDFIFKRRTDDAIDLKEKDFLKFFYTFFFTNWRGLFLFLVLIGFSYFLILLPVIWCFRNPFLLFIMTLASIIGVSLFYLYVWLVKKIKKVKVRALLYSIFFLVLWLITVIMYGNDTVKNPLGYIAFTPLSLLLVWVISFYCKDAIEEEVERGCVSIEKIILLISFVNVLAFSVCLVKIVGI